MRPVTVLPSSPTIAERISWRLSLPFPVVCLVISAVVTLPILPYAFPDAQPSMMTTALNRGMGVFGDQGDVVMGGVLLLFFAYLLFAVRFMRLRVAKTLVEAHDRFEVPEETFVAAFEPVGWRWPVVTLALILTALSVGTFVTEGHTIEPGYVPAFVLDLLVGAGRLMILGAFVWAYFASVRGLWLVCRQPLRLVPYYEDGLLGMRPLGALSLSLASAFALGYAIGIVWTMHDPIRAGFLVLGLGILALAVLFFILPLWNVHRQMADEKKRELRFVRERYSDLFEVSRHQVAREQRDVTLSDVTAAIALQASERRIATIHSWPLDTDILIRLVTSFGIPVVLTVIGREAILVVLGL